ncbi:NADPH-dependent F420 reductase [Trujillonella humicola]|uniref:NADPH-dependent F420 reductase n=1 Tax=Trujillonella humicola TaxID=3383699 RepID=UPI003905AD4E
MSDGRAVEDLVVGVLGGTGPQGRGLAVRLAAAGQRVLLGSRDGDRAAEVAGQVAERASTAGGLEASVQGGANADVAGAADLVIVAVPFAGHAATLAELAEPLAGKVVVDCVVPMGFDELGAYVLEVPEGSVAQQAAGLLPDSHVVGAFHHLSAVLLEDLSRPTLDGDVMVVGDDRASTDLVQALAGRLPGMRGIYAGRLRNAAQVEALTINLVSVNRRYKAHAGVRITDV